MNLCSAIAMTAFATLFCCSRTVALVTLAAVSHGQEALPSSSYTVQVRLLGPVPASDKIRKEVVTLDGRNVVWRVALENGECVVLNGRPDPAVSVVKSATIVSPDGNRVAYKSDAEAGAKRVLVVDGKPGPTLDQVNNDTILFSSDSKRLAYSGERNGGSVLVLDQQVLAEGANVKSDALFSPDFSRVAYKAGLAGDKRGVRLDGVTGVAFSQVNNASMAFSRNGRQFVYVASEGEGNKAKVMVVLNGTPGEPYDRVSALTFSPDSNHLAYIAADANKERVVLDGSPGPAFDSIDPYFLRFTPSGQLYYRAERHGKMVLMLDGKAISESPGILDWSAGAKGRGIAIITRAGEAWSVVFDGAKGPDYTTISAPVAVSVDGTHFAYAATQGHQAFIVKDGMPGAAWELISQGPSFSSDGSHWGYVARRDGKWFVAVDGRENGPYDWFAWGSLQFSADGRHCAFLVQKAAKWIVVLDSKTVVECDGVATTPARFSANGRHFACMIRQGTKWRMVLDGEPGPLFDRLFDVTPEFAPDASLEYPAVRDNRLYRVKHTLAPQR
jgi:WD40 repeat protein